jgi:heme oxygenase (mycobilin-producing)
MAVKVLITRQFTEGKQKQAYKTIMELRSLATLQQGYMSGETLIGADDPNKVVVISSWISRKRWEDWQSNPKRKEVAKSMEALLESPERVECFLVGEKVPEWVDMA